MPVKWPARMLSRGKLQNLNHRLSGHRALYLRVGRNYTIRNESSEGCKFAGMIDSLEMTKLDVNERRYAV